MPQFIHHILPYMSCQTKQLVLFNREDDGNYGRMILENLFLLPPGNRIQIPPHNMSTLQYGGRFQKGIILMEDTPRTTIHSDYLV